MDDADERAGPYIVLVDASERVAWVRDYGAPEHGGLMYVPPQEIVNQIADKVGKG